MVDGGSDLRVGRSREGMAGDAVRAGADDEGLVHDPSKRNGQD